MSYGMYKRAPPLQKPPSAASFSLTPIACGGGSRFIPLHQLIHDRRTWELYPIRVCMYHHLVCSPRCQNTIKRTDGGLLRFLTYFCKKDYDHNARNNGGWREVQKKRRLFSQNKTKKHRKSFKNDSCILIIDMVSVTLPTSSSP